MGHEVFEELLARRAELSAPEARALDEHLLTCAHCQADAEAYREQDALLREFAAKVTTGDSVAEIKRGVAERLERPKSVSGFRFQVSRGYREHVAKRLPEMAPGRPRRTQGRRLNPLMLAPALALLLGAALVLPQGVRAPVQPMTTAIPSPVPLVQGEVPPAGPARKMHAPHRGPKLGIDTPGPPAGLDFALPSAAQPALARLGVSLSPPSSVMAPPGWPRVRAGMARHQAQRVWPHARVEQTLLATVVAPHLAALNGRLCWVVTLTQGGQPHSARRIHLVFVDARSGEMVLAAS